MLCFVVAAAAVSAEYFTWEEYQAAVAAGEVAAYRGKSTAREKYNEGWAVKRCVDQALV